MPDPDADRSVDVVVVGGGGAGMAAALAAREAGAEVVLLEEADALGGATAMAVGSISVAETDHQAERGIDDAVDAHFDDVGKFVRQAAESPRHVNLDRQGTLAGKDDLALRRLMVERGPETFVWLQGIGVEYEGPHPEPPHRVPRMHNVQPDADAYRDVLGEAVDAAGVDVRLGTAATGLVTEDGAVGGVRTDDGTAIEAAGGVVLATGGFVADRDLRREFTTDHAAPPISDHGAGAGHRMARGVGASLVRMDLQWLSFRLGEPLWTEPAIPALTDEGAILVGPDGRRYVNERSDYDQLFDATLDSADGACFVVFDDDVAGTFSAWPNYVSTFPGIAYGYVSDYAGTDYLSAANDLRELADLVGMDPTEFEETVDSYNAAATGKRVDRYGRAAFGGPVDSPPYHALGPARPVALITDGGVQVNTRLEALDREETPIDGLYAVGDTAGGPLRLGHGHHHLWLFVSGRTAGAEAARRADRR